MKVELDTDVNAVLRAVSDLCTAHIEGGGDPAMLADGLREQADVLLEEPEEEDAPRALLLPGLDFGPEVQAEAEDKATAFVTIHDGRRLGWKICRGDRSSWHPDSRYYGRGDQRPPAEAVTQQRLLFDDWEDAVRWCASFPAHPAEGGAPPRPHGDG
jgi:hypothetical protein